MMMMKVLLPSSFLLRSQKEEEEECVDDDGLGQSNSLSSLSRFTGGVVICWLESNFYA